MRALTVDVEDYHSLVARDKLGVALPVCADVDREVGYLLELLSDLDVKATCFVVGRVAQERPQIVRMIMERGHEIASHGFHHLLMHQLNPRSFRDDLRTSIDVLQEITGAAVEGFRAPAFSLRDEHRWAFEVMADEGIRYDSSVRVTWPFGLDAGRSLIDTANAYGLLEFPSLALGWGRYRVPIEGGGGLRLVPEFISSLAVKRSRRAGFSIPIYVHPYDLTTTVKHQWPAASWSKRIRFTWFDWLQHRGRAKVAPRLHRLVRRLREEDPAGIQLTLQTSR